MEGSNLSLNNGPYNTRIGLHFGCSGVVPFVMKDNAQNLISDTSGKILFYISESEVYDSTGTAIVKFNSSDKKNGIPLQLFPFREIMMRFIYFTLTILTQIRVKKYCIIVYTISRAKP
jgi:hypothetical protein